MAIARDNRHTGLRGVRRTDQLDVLAELLLQLAQAALAERDVGGPPALVEGGARRGDRPLDVLRAGVRRGADHLFGGRVDVVVPGAAAGLDELARDEHPLLGNVHSWSPLSWSKPAQLGGPAGNLSNEPASTRTCWPVT